MHSLDNWPLPPFFKESLASDAPGSLDVIVFALDGAIHRGQLLAFDPVTTSVRFVPRGSAESVLVKFTGLKSVQMIHPLDLAPDAGLIALYQRSGGQVVAPVARSFTVVFSDGEQLQGSTKGFVKTRYGLFVYLVTEADCVVRIFVPESMLRSYQFGGLLGQQLVSQAHVTPQALQLALAEQKRRRQALLDQHLGDTSTADAAISGTDPGELASLYARASGGYFDGPGAGVPTAVGHSAGTSEP